MPEGKFWAVERAERALSELPVTTEQWFADLEQWQVGNDEDQEFAAGLLRAIKARWEYAEEQRKTITTPLNQALKATNGLFKPRLEELQHAEKLLKAKIADYVSRKQLANSAALLQAAQMPTQQQATQIISQIAPVAPPQGVSVRQVWKFEVVDPDAVPRELCSPDPKKIGAYEPGTEIPGVRWFQEAVVSSRK